MNTKNKPNLIIYQKYMSLIYYTNDILKKYKEEFHVSDEAFKSMSDQWNSVLKSEDILKKQSEAERLIKDAQGQLEENKPLMEQIRKWSEAYKKSCRL